MIMHSWAATDRCGSGVSFAKDVTGGGCGDENQANYKSVYGEFASAA